MENRKAAGRPVRKYEKPEASEARYSENLQENMHQNQENPVQRAIKKIITLIRLNRFIANSGVCSRRDADEHIKNGLISVNGKIVTDHGNKGHL